MLIGQWKEKKKSQVLADPQMVQWELRWDHELSQTNSSRLQYLWTLFLPSLSDFRACILQLLSNRLVRVSVRACMCRHLFVCVEEQKEICGREKEVQVLNSLSVCQRCRWMLNISAFCSNSLSQHCGGCGCISLTPYRLVTQHQELDNEDITGNYSNKIYVARI